MPPPNLPGKKGSKRRKQLIIVAGAAGLLLLFLYMRSRSSSGQTASNASNADVQSAVDQAIANQQQQDAQLYGQMSAGGYGAGGSPSIDTSGLATGSTSTDQLASDIGSLGTSLSDLPSQIAAQLPVATPGPVIDGGAGATASQPTQPPVAQPAPVVVNIGSQPAGRGSGAGGAGGVRLSTLSGAQKRSGIVAAPFGAHKPTAPAGYVAVGLGSGNWGFKVNTRKRK